MKNRKIRKSLLLAFVITALLSLTCFADTKDNAVFFRIKSDNNYTLNAYTSSVPKSGTKVTMYKLTDTDTQKFYTNGGYLYNARSGYNPDVRVAYSYQNAIFRHVTYDSTLAHFSVEYSNGYYKFYLDQIENEYTTLTAPLNYTSETAQVKFQMDSKLNNQRWKLG